jgi:hypothetical protein
MTLVLDTKRAESKPASTQEYRSGEIVEPGVYMDMETGTIVQVRERDELPEGTRVVRYRRRFRRLEAPSRA